MRRGIRVEYPGAIRHVMSRGNRREEIDVDVDQRQPRRGPSHGTRLLVADKNLQAEIKAMMADGVVAQACIACADSYGATRQLRDLGIEVKGMGIPFAVRTVRVYEMAVVSC